MAMLHQPNGSESTRSICIFPKDQGKGFTLEELRNLLGDQIAYFDISDEYIMLFNVYYQTRHYCGYNAEATRKTYNQFEPDNKAFYGDVIFLEDCEISKELRVREEKAV